MLLPMTNHIGWLRRAIEKLTEKTFFDFDVTEERLGYETFEAEPITRISTTPLRVSTCDHALMFQLT